MASKECDDEHDEESVQISLLDGESGLEFRFMVRPEDAERARTDHQFAASLLQHAKINYKPYEVTKETGYSEVELNTQKSVNEDAASKTWPYNATLALISAIKERYEDLNHPKKRKHVWDFISEHLQSLNVICTAKECHTKYRNLIRTYNNVKDNKNKTGRGCIRFHFYDEMDDLLGDKPTNTSEHVIDLAKENDMPLNDNGECSGINSNTSNQMLTAEECQNDTEDTTSDNSSSIEPQKNKKRKLTKNETVTLKLDYIKKKKAFIEEEKERRQKESEKRDSRNEEKLKLKRERNEIEKQKLTLLKMYFENEKK